ncbi:MAG TPA: outer membrane protein assembly factor BamA [Acidobacteriota bacterium]|nr:outer membrane protein assembly factor BamA [Acidobacteriota bacterium]
MNAVATHGRHLRTLTPYFRSRRCRNAFLLHGLCTLFLSLLFAAPSNPAEPETLQFGKTIRSIEFSADAPLNRTHYDPFLGIKPGDVLTRTGVKHAIQFLYECGRFSGISVEALPVGDGVQLLFRLRYNYYFNKFSVAGNLDLKGRSLWEWGQLPTGQRFTEEKLEQSRQAMLKFMAERGFYGAQVQARTLRDEKNRQVNVVFDVQPGALAAIRSIEVTGVPSRQAEKLRHIFGFQKGKKYDRSRLSPRLDNIKNRLFKEGFLAATVQLSESFDPPTHTIALNLAISNYGKMKVAVDGFKIDKDQLRRLLPVLAGEGTDREILEEGRDNLKSYLENKGYSEADVRIVETIDNSGLRSIHYRMNPGKKYEVSYIRFTGNHALTAEQMLSSIETQPKGFFKGAAYTPTRLDSDVDTLKALYQLSGYLDVKITPLVEMVDKGRKLGITFRCEEGPRATTRSLTVEGNIAFSREELMHRMKLAPGKPYSPALAERDRQTLLTAYNDLGYLRAQVTVKAGAQDEANSYPVEFQIREGSRAFVERILVLGNERTRDSVIEKKIRIKENEPLSLVKMLQTQQGLYGLGVFDQVRVAPQNSDSQAPYQDVVVRMEESKRFTMRYGLGYQEREKLRGTLEFMHENFLGMARRAQFRIRGSSIEQEAIFSLQKPQFRPIAVDSSFSFSYQYAKNVGYDSRKFNLSYQFSHPFGNHTWGMLRYNFRNVHVLNSQISESELGREDNPCNFSTFSVAFINDTRDNYLDPTKGFFSSTNFGVTPRLISSQGFLSFFTQNSYYRRIPGSLLLASSLRFGAAYSLETGPDLPISERFFAGGSSSLRGFDTDYAGPLDPQSNKPLGGNALIVGSVEIRVPIFSFIHFAGLYDTGNVFRTISDINASGFSHTIGGGLRIKTPFGPLRADYGYNLNLPSDSIQRGLKRGHFFITVGPPF